MRKPTKKGNGMKVDIESVKKIIKHYGYRHQMVKACEELSELQTVILQEVNKHDKYPVENIASLTEELADCYVMLRQIEMINCLDSRDIEPIIEGKLARTLERIDNERWKKEGESEETNVHRR